MTEEESYQELKRKLTDREWRLYNLYYIVDKSGNPIQFTPNEHQRRAIIDEVWYLEIILKARQLGVSTGFEIAGLDMCLFSSNTTFGIIDVTLDDAKTKLEKCRFAYNKLPDWLKSEIKLIEDNKQTLVFSNGSKITADTSFRGSTVQMLHISEFAKICKKDPTKAREIVTGALNAVAAGQFVFIESTAEDAEGYFYDIVQRARKLQLQGVGLTKLDYRYFFFPWYEDENYSLSKPDGFVFSQASSDYFNKLERMGIKLTKDQQFWYVKKKEEQGDQMKKEYPSDWSESFEAAIEDKYYMEQILLAESDHRITEFGIDKGFPINIVSDLGLSDYTSIIFYQLIGKEIRIVDFIEINRIDVPEISKEILLKDYLLGTLALPHDAFATRLGMGGKNIAQQFQEYNFKIVSVPGPAQVDVISGISLVRKYFDRFWFKRSTTEKLVSHLQMYKKKWSEAAGKYVGPDHDIHSHAADALRYLATVYNEPLTKEKKRKTIKNKYSPYKG